MEWISIDLAHNDMFYSLILCCMASLYTCWLMFMYMCIDFSLGGVQRKLEALANNLRQVLLWNNSF